MDALVDIPMVYLIVSAVTLVAINLKNVKKIESISFAVCTGRNSGITSQRLERDLDPFSI